MNGTETVRTIHRYDSYKFLVITCNIEFCLVTPTFIFDTQKNLQTKCSGEGHVLSFIDRQNDDARITSVFRTPD
jgi:hypothetical protein